MVCNGTFDHSGRQVDIDQVMTKVCVIAGEKLGSSAFHQEEKDILEHS